jgi:hypothetical protein
LNRYTVGNTPEFVPGPGVVIAPGESAEISWKIEGPGSQPICQIGVELAAPGVIYLDSLAWGGSPDVVFAVPENPYPWHTDPNWRKPWVYAADQWEAWGSEGLRIVQNDGRGLLIIGCREWQDYTTSATIRPTLLQSGGIAARVQGLMRFYALQLVRGGKARLIKALDGDAVLAETPFAWEMWQPYEMALEVKGSRLRGWIGGQLLFDVEDAFRPLTGGGVALVVEEGHLMTASVKVQPA